MKVEPVDYCELCARHKMPRRPKTPSRLAKTIDMLKNAVRDGQLVEDVDNAAPYYTPFDDIETGMWTSFIYSRFQCSNCGTKFVLEAECEKSGLSNRFERAAK